MKFKLWLEAFDTVSDFLLNPDHRNMTFDELLQKFKASGGEYIGSGRYGQVFSHPKWNYVVKLYDDEYYTRFVRFANRNPNPAFPKFYGTPQRVLPFYRRHKENTFQYLVRMEKLLPLPTDIGKIIAKNYDTIAYELNRGNLSKNSQEVINQNPRLLPVFKAISEIMFSNIVGALDIHPENLMQRANGDIVIIDPLWSGSNPYADYDRMMDMEGGHNDYEVYKEPNVIGGKFPKKIRKKKWKPSPQVDIPDGEIPF